MELITVLGLVAATLTTSSFLPQAIKIIRTKDTKGLSLFMYIILSTGVFLWLIYGVFIKDIPLVIANGVTFIFNLIILFYLIKYRPKS